MPAPKGNKHNEVWTLKKSKDLYDKALIMAQEGALTLTSIAKELGVYTHVFDYILEKHKNSSVDFTSIKKEILKCIEDTTYTGALQGSYVPSVAIFALKNNHGWSDKQEIDHTTKGESIQQTIIQLGTGTPPIDDDRYNEENG